VQELVAAEMKRLRELMDRIRDKSLREQLVLIRAHIIATEHEAQNGNL